MKLLEQNLPNVNLVICQYETGEPDKHAHPDEFQVNIPLIGNPIFIQEGASRDINPFQRLLIPPNDVHEHFSTGELVKMIILKVKQRYLNEILTQTINDVNISLDFELIGTESSESIKNMIQNFITSTIRDDINDLQLDEFEYNVAQALLTIHKGSHSEAWAKSLPRHPHPVINQALELIHDEFNHSLSLDYISNNLHISKSYLIKLFNDYIGKPPSKYINEIRLYHSEKLLKNPKIHITDVAFHSGYGSLSAFYRSFKEKYHLLPNEYRSLFK